MSDETKCDWCEDFGAVGGCDKCGKINPNSATNLPWLKPTAPAPQASEVRTWLITRIGGRVDVKGPDTPHTGGNEVRVIEHAAYLRLAAELEQVKGALSASRAIIKAFDTTLSNALNRAEAAEARVKELESREITGTTLHIRDFAQWEALRAERDHAQAEVKRLREALEDLLPTLVAQTQIERARAALGREK